MSLFPVDAADEPKTWTNLAQSSTSCWILIEGVPHRFTAAVTRSCRSTASIQLFVRLAVAAPKI